jgi:hypothetical protein
VKKKNGLGNVGIVRERSFNAGDKSKSRSEIKKYKKSTCTGIAAAGADAPSGIIQLG